MAITFPTDGQAFTIAELSPPFRIVRLAGGDRPEQPIEIASEQRATQQWLPGSSKAVVQFMGTKNDPIVLKGWFKDPLSALGGATPEVQFALLKGLQQSGSLCRLVWGTVIIKTGRIKRVVDGVYRQGRRRYEIVFDVDQDDNAASMIPIPTAPGTQASFALALRIAVESAKKLVQVVRLVKVVKGVVT